MKRVLTIAAAAGALGLFSADIANAQTLGGFPIREPGAGSGAGSGGGGGSKPSKGAQQIIVDANGPGPYKTISKAVDDIAEGGVIYVMHGVYDESVRLTKSVFLQGDRGPGSGVEIRAPLNAPCLSFTPKEGTAHAVVANISLQSMVNTAGEACVQVASGVFTMKESDVLGASAAPAVRISGGTVMLEKNRISAGSEGVRLEQNHTLSQTFIIDNKIGGNKVGVDIASGSRADVVVSGNEIFDNLETGIKSSGYGGASLIGNKIRNNKGSGIYLERFSKLALVRYNEIVKNAGDGVAVPFGANGIIEDNDIVGNDGLGIYVREGLEPKITNNFIENNKGDGKRPKRSR